MKCVALNYDRVTLKPGHWRRQVEETLETLLGISEDGLLYRFRKRAGLAAPGTELTGWYNDGGSNFGQILGALAKLYRATGDARVHGKLIRLINGWGACIREDGFALFPDGRDNTYLVEKLLNGLTDAYEYAGIAVALAYARRVLDYTILNMPRDFSRSGLHDDDMVRHGVIEWYTLPESVYRIYRLTGEPSYLRFAQEMEHRDYWRALLNGDTVAPRHAYSHVNCLNSAAQAYAATGNCTYRDIAIAGYARITRDQLYATGGYGPHEVLFGPDGYLGDSVLSPFDPRWQNLSGAYHFSDPQGAHDNCEVSCCTWAAFKLCGHLTEMTGEARYAEWAELLLLNCMGAQLPLSPGGRVMYYANYAVNGSFKTVEDNRLRADGSNYRWQCCTGTFPQNVAEYQRLIAYQADDCIMISQFIPATISAQINDVPVTIDGEGAFPLEEQANWVIKLPTALTFTVALREPKWAKGVSITVNGEALEVPERKDGWIMLRRRWNNGDSVRLRMPYHLRFQSVDARHPSIRALCYGPLVLAGTEMCRLYGDVEHPEAWIKPVDGAPCSFYTDAGHDAAYAELRRVFKPLYRFAAAEWYYMYNDITDAPAARGTEVQQ